MRCPCPIGKRSVVKVLDIYGWTERRNAFIKLIFLYPYSRESNNLEILFNNIVIACANLYWKKYKMFSRKKT